MFHDTARAKITHIEESNSEPAPIVTALETNLEPDPRAFPYSGAVLAGGKSSRFNSDKALHVWRGKTLLEYALGSLERCAETFVVGGDHQLNGITVYPDLEPHAGSLYGLRRALEVARFDRVAVTACDMPNLTGGYWNWLMNMTPCDVLIPRSASGDLEPLAAVYSKACLPFVQRSLERGNLKLTGWWDASLSVTVIDWLEVQSHFGEDVFLNANMPTDLEPG